VVLKDRTAPEEDAALVEVARAWAARAPGRLVFATRLDRVGQGEPARWAAQPAFAPDLPITLGFANVPTGPDGVIRWAVPLEPAADGGFIPSLAVAALAGHAGVSAASLASALRAPARGAAIALTSRSGRGGALSPEPVAVNRLAAASWRIDY